MSEDLQDKKRDALIAAIEGFDSQGLVDWTRVYPIAIRLDVILQSILNINIATGIDIQKFVFEMAVKGLEYSFYNEPEAFIAGFSFRDLAEFLPVDSLVKALNFIMDENDMRFQSEKDPVGEDVEAVLHEEFQLDAEPEPEPQPQPDPETDSSEQAPQPPPPPPDSGFESEGSKPEPDPEPEEKGSKKKKKK